MRQGITLFEQLQALLPRPVVWQATAACQGDFKVQVATCWSQVVWLMLAVLTRQRSLRHIGQSLKTRLTYLRRFGLGSVDRSTLSHANARRPHAVAEALFQALLLRGQRIAPRHPFRFRGRLYSLDATVIHVCHTLQQWAVWAPQRAGIKLHVALDHGGELPTLIDITSARVYERSVARDWHFPEGSVLCFDRGYFDSGWFRDLLQRRVVFVTRWAYGARYRVVRERPVEAGGPVRADQVIRFAGKTSRVKFHGTLRLITYRDPNSGRTFQFVTNQKRWSAQRIADIYQARWRIELFFKWLKQQLPVLHFYGHSANAVRWQLYLALCVYLLLSWIRFRTRLEQSLTAIARRLEPHLFDIATLDDLLHGTYQFQT